MRPPCFTRKAQELQRPSTDERYSIRASLRNNDEDSPESYMSQDDNQRTCFHATASGQVHYHFK